MLFRISSLTLGQNFNSYYLTKLSGFSAKIGRILTKKLVWIYGKYNPQHFGLDYGSKFLPGLKYFQAFYLTFPWKFGSNVVWYYAKKFALKNLFKFGPKVRAKFKQNVDPNGVNFDPKKNMLECCPEKATNPLFLDKILI